MAKIKVDDLIKGLKYVESNRWTFYSNSFPYNCGYIHANGAQSWDCIGLVKCPINEPDIFYRNSPVGYYVTPGQVIPDTTELGLLNLCTDVKYTFGYVARGEYMYMAGHGAWFVGEYTDPSGVVNVIEATGAMGGGVLSSYCDSNGYRYDHKGGTCLGRWEAHGKLSAYIEYDAPKPTPTEKIDEDGEFGSKTVALAQKVLSWDWVFVKDDQTGCIKGQLQNLIKTNVPAYVQGAWLFNGGGCNTVKAIQSVLQKQRLYTDSIDGIWGRNTSLGLQKWLNRMGNYGLVEDSIFGYNSTKAYQNFLNKCI